MPTPGKDQALPAKGGTFVSSLGLVPHKPSWPGNSVLSLNGRPSHEFFSLPFQVCVAAAVLYAPGTKGWLTTSSPRTLRWVTSPAGISLSTL